jgi:hypothetical protein
VAAAHRRGESGLEIIRPAQTRRHPQAFFGVFQHGLDLFAGYAGEPFEKIVHRRAVFEILKQRRHRHARVFEQPRAADLSGDAFHGGTLAPIQHDETITLIPRACKSRLALRSLHKRAVIRTESFSRPLKAKS